MEVIRTLSVAAALPLVALPQSAAAQNVAGWLITPEDRGCAMSASFEGDTTLHVFYEPHVKLVKLAIANEIFKGLQAGKDYKLAVFFIRRGRIDDRWGTNDFEGIISNETRAVMGRYEPELLDDLAASDGIRIERDDTLVASLKLTGTAKAIPVLQACAHRVAKANPIDPFDDGSDAPNTGGLAKPVSARGSAGAWVTDDDYPAAALRAEQEGTVGFKLDVDAAGAVLNCAITTSSGSALLDVTACSLIKRRARFNPAQNAAGVKIAGTFESRFTWRIPR